MGSHDSIAVGAVAGVLPSKPGTIQSVRSHQPFPPQLGMAYYCSRLPGHVSNAFTIERFPMRVSRCSKLVSASTRALQCEALAPPQSTESAALRPYFALCFFSALLFTLSSAVSHAQDSTHALDYTSIVVFGDSLSDTGNVAHLTEAKYGIRIPGPYADYTDGRFTDGADTLPPAEKYFGVWIEQFAAQLPSKPKIKDSLDGGTDYAYGFATTGAGTGLFTFGPSDSLSVNVNNIAQQITDYLATHPKIDDKTLFVVWGGANDILTATSEDDVIDAGINQILNIQRLVDAGATQFIVPNLPPLGLVPRLNGSPTTSVLATEESVLYNDVLGGGIALLRDFDFRKHLHLSQLDVFALFNRIVASPSTYSLVDVTASSQGIAVDPDTYLFWDDLHPTTRGHNILATTAAKIVAQNGCRANSVADGRNLTDSYADCLVESDEDPIGVRR
jgi:phospholipase/lecithinase/hemolysin